MTPAGLLSLLCFTRRQFQHHTEHDEDEDEDDDDDDDKDDDDDDDDYDDDDDDAFDGASRCCESSFFMVCYLCSTAVFERSYRSDRSTKLL